MLYRNPILLFALYVQIKEFVIQKSHSFILPYKPVHYKSVLLQYDPLLKMYTVCESTLTEYIFLTSLALKQDC